MRSGCRVSGLLLVSVPFLVSCTGVVPVRDVTTDKFAYLHNKFTSSTASVGVVSAITAKDPGTLPFQRITFDVTPHIEAGQNSTEPLDFHSTWTYVNAGGPFVQVLDEPSSNGIATRQDYSLSYRGTFTLRQQTVLLNRESSNMVMEAKAIKAFTPIATGGSGAGTVDYEYQWGTAAQLMNFQTLSVHCVYGSTYPAADLNPKLKGDAQEITCEYNNMNGVSTGNAVRTLLRQYGITVPKRNRNSAGTTTFKIDNVRIE